MFSHFYRMSMDQIEQQYELAHKLAKGQHRYEEAREIALALLHEAEINEPPLKGLAQCVKTLLADINRLRRNGASQHQ